MRIILVTHVNTDKVASKITVSCMLVAMAIKGKSGLNQAAYVK